MKKFNLLVPLAGKGQRFVDAGFKTPKPMININGKSIIELSLSSFDYKECNIVFVVRREHVQDYNIDGFLKSRFGDNIEVVVIDKDTNGSVESCIHGIERSSFDRTLPLFIHTSDVFFEKNGSVISPNLFSKDIDGTLLVFKSNSKNYSYSKVENGLVSRVAEKEVISDLASCGLYYFSSTDTFHRYALKMVNENLRSNGEYYIAPLYNLLIGDSLSVNTIMVDKMHIFGTPDEYEFYRNNTLRTYSPLRKIGICADHSGFDLKNDLKSVLTEIGYEVVDFGTYTPNDCDYVEFVTMACEAYLSGDVDLVIGSCRSGQGVNITANKIKGIRGALIHNQQTAALAIRHNCANFITLPSSVVTKNDIHDIMYAISSNTFDGGRHQARISKIGG